MIEAEVKSPTECNSDELKDFMDLVLKGGEVTSRGLSERVARAQQLSFLRRDQVLVGVAGLKRPQAAYRDGIASSANVELSYETTPFELGWVFVKQEARGARLSMPLCKPLINAARGHGIFSTSRASNHPMQVVLVRLGFRYVGKPWPSKQNDDQVRLFVKDTEAI